MLLQTFGLRKPSTIRQTRAPRTRHSSQSPQPDTDIPQLGGLDAALHTASNNPARNIKNNRYSENTANNRNSENNTNNRYSENNTNTRHSENNTNNRYSENAIYNRYQENTQNNQSFTSPSPQKASPNSPLTSPLSSPSIPALFGRVKRSNKLLQRVTESDLFVSAVSPIGTPSPRNAMLGTQAHEQHTLQQSKLKSPEYIQASNIDDPGKRERLPNNVNGVDAGSLNVTFESDYEISAVNGNLQAKGKLWTKDLDEDIPGLSMYGMNQRGPNNRFSDGKSMYGMSQNFQSSKASEGKVMYGMNQNIQNEPAYFVGEKTLKLSHEGPTDRSFTTQGNPDYFDGKRGYGQHNQKITIDTGDSYKSPTETGHGSRGFQSTSPKFRSAVRPENTERSFKGTNAPLSNSNGGANEDLVIKNQIVGLCYDEVVVKPAGFLDSLYSQVFAW